MRAVLIWAALALAVALPVVAATISPQLAWREPVYIVAGFAGIIGLGLMLVQPLMIGGYLPGISVAQARRLHGGIGIAIVMAVAIHVGGLWVTSPPDVIDALMFTSPTPFTPWGVVAMWAVVAIAFLFLSRHHLRLRPRTWRQIHTALVLVVVIGTVVHSVLIQGTMETVSKAVLCALLIVALLKVIVDKRVWKKPEVS